MTHTKPEGKKKGDYKFKKNSMKDIRQKLAQLGYKIDFWYNNGRLDAICVARFEGENLNHKKTYTVDEIANIIFDDFINNK